MVLQSDPMCATVEPFISTNRVVGTGEPLPPTVMEDDDYDDFDEDDFDDDFDDDFEEEIEEEYDMEDDSEFDGGFEDDLASRDDVEMDDEAAFDE